MKKSIVSLLALLAFVAHAKDTAKTEPQAATGNLIPEGFVLVEEAYLTEVRELPGQFLADARSSFREKNYAAAASDIESAARLMKTESGRKVKGSELSSEAGRLEDLASQVREGKVTSEKQLSDAFADAAKATAEHHRLKAAADWAEGKAKLAGHELMAAVKAGERAIEWSGREAAKGTKTAFDDARDVAGKLIEGGGKVTADVGKVIDATGNAIQRLGRATEPTRTAE